MPLARKAFLAKSVLTISKSNYATRDADSIGTRVMHDTHRVEEQEAFKEINYLLYCTRGTRGP